jgi:enoyl-CoA hydratase/carnithine racemase
MRALSTDDLVLAELHGGVLLATLNRPDRLNAWTFALGRRLQEVLIAADRDPVARAIVITGAGRGFCPGADLEVVADVADAGEADAPPRATLAATLTTPVVAAINGACAGLGLAIALACDVRFAAPEAKITAAFVRRGLIAEHGLSWTLPRVVGRSRALDLLLSGRVVTGTEALAIGLVDFVADDPLEAAMAYARDLADLCSPRAMATIKRQVADDPGVGLEEAMARTERLTAASLAWGDIGEGIRSYVERRPPKFPALDTSHLEE